MLLKPKPERQRCCIEGLSLDENRIQKVESKTCYDTEELDLLLCSHSDKIMFKLIDEQFFNPETIDVFEFEGKSYAIKYLKN